MSIPRILHFTIPRVPSAAQLGIIEIARRLHPAWEIKVWQDPVSPAGFVLSKYWPFVNSGAQWADLIRIECLLKYGGVYLDSDVRLHRALDDLVGHCDFFIASENGNALTNAAFGAAPGHPALAALVDELAAHAPDWTLPPNLTTGPALFTRILAERSDVTLLPRATFYPYRCDEPPAAAHPWSYGTHLWAASWLEECIAHARRAGGLPARLLRDFKRHAWAAEKRVAAGWARVRAAGMRRVRAWRRAWAAISGQASPGTSRPVEMLCVQADVSPAERFLRRSVHGGDFCVDAGVTSECGRLLADLTGRFGRVIALRPSPGLACATTPAVLPVALSAILAGGASQLAGASTLHAVDPGSVEGVGSGCHAEVVAAASLHAMAAVSRDAAGRVGATLDNALPCNWPITLLGIGQDAQCASILRGARRLLGHQCIDFVMLCQGTSATRVPMLSAAMCHCCECGYTVFEPAPDGRLLPLDHGLRFRGEGRDDVPIVLASASVVERRPELFVAEADDSQHDPARFSRMGSGVLRRMAGK